MNKKSHSFGTKTPQQNSGVKNIFGWAFRGVALAGILLAGHWAWAQSIPQPVLTITPAVSNQMVISITNGVSTANYDLYWTPVLANPAYPWKAAVIGSTGQTNFTVSMGVWQNQFYRVVVDTNSVPIWEAADPNNPSAGILAVFIDSPVNGTVLQ
jgi:hypothetical protein